MSTANFMKRFPKYLCGLICSLQLTGCTVFSNGPGDESIPRVGMSRSEILDNYDVAEIEGDFWGGYQFGGLILNDKVYVVVYEINGQEYKNGTDVLKKIETMEENLSQSLNWLKPMPEK